MRRKLFFITLLTFGLLTIVFPERTVAQTEKSLVEKLRKEEPSEGKVTIEQSPEIANLLGKRGEGQYYGADELREYIRAKGFRLQMFDGSNPKTAKTDAFLLKKKLETIFPEIHTYVIWKSPFWKVRIGDFRTWEEADHFLREFKKNHFKLCKVAFIVPDEVKLDIEKEETTDIKE